MNESQIVSRDGPACVPGALAAGIFMITVIVCVAVCCSMLQYVAVCCNVLRCIAVCCSVLQCVAV